MIIIGAGPAGLACGIAAARCGERVEILEKNNRPGVKLRLSGSGQCNLTHGGPLADFLNHYGGAKQSRLVKPALFAFSPSETIRFFEQRGIPLFEREDGKIFPQSLQSGDVLRALIDELESNGGHLHTNVEVSAIQRPDDGFCVETNRGVFSSKRLAIATGGMSFPQTGSTGEGYRWAEQWGHRIVPPRPGLTPVIVERFPFADASGISFENVPIAVYRNGKKHRQGCGDVLLTHRGLSGPGILDLSRFIEPQDVICMPICRNAGDLESLLCGKKLLKNALAPLDIPDRLLQLLLAERGISPETSAAEVCRETRLLLKQSLAGFPFVVDRLGGFDEAMSTCGGVALDDVNRLTMESRLVPGLFFCGEILDIDGDTGGYNIQFALSSGFLAGSEPQS
ncbi:MAG: NAD(P)/FAD-dependent oxidoreductase [Planctomycetaceae bacterium]|jgi:predicted Rossmann fold flavoprotein|nr:NAD(P)/FAD-dependent oxidoreductase [Planctomycetaceae bacterium]